MTSRDRGAAAVEFALVLPLLLLLTFAIIDLGRALNAHILLAESASEAARSLAIGGTVDQAKTDARAVVDGDSTVPRDALQFPRARGCSPTTRQAEVTVTVQFQLLTPLPVSATSFTLSGVGVRQCFV